MKGLTTLSIDPDLPEFGDLGITNETVHDS